MAQLQELDVSNNSLNTLPNELGELRNLQKLNISGNKLVSIPSKDQNYLFDFVGSVGDLGALTILDCKSNEISGLFEIILC